MKLSNIVKSYAIYPICKLFLLFLVQQLIIFAQQLIHIAQQLILTAQQVICASVRLKPTQSSLAGVGPELGNKEYFEAFLEGIVDKNELKKYKLNKLIKICQK